MSANAALITMETCTRGKILKTSFSYMSQNVKKKYIFGFLGGPEGGLQLSDWAYVAFQLSSHPNLCTCRIRKECDKKFLSLNTKYARNILWKSDHPFQFLPWFGGSSFARFFNIWAIHLNRIKCCNSHTRSTQCIIHYYMLIYIKKLYLRNSCLEMNVM